MNRNTFAYCVSTGDLIISAICACTKIFTIRILKKETVLIPQSHIIDDIVKQAEIAFQGKNYKDVFVTSPTGPGKSIMFKIPAIHLAEKYGMMTIVISPLIGLVARPRNIFAREYFMVQKDEESSSSGFLKRWDYS